MQNQAILRIGLVYDRAVDYGVTDGPADRFAEFEPESTINVMEQAVLEAGHYPVRIGSPRKLLETDPDVDVIWNIGEGYGSRNREAWAPVLCEMRGIPCLGSDAYTLTVTLDKILSKQIARSLDIPTSDWQIIRYHPSQTGTLTSRAGYPDFSISQKGPKMEHTESEPAETSIPKPVLPFPIFLKPRYEGTAKGITERSIVHNETEFDHQCRYLLSTYRQDVMAEPFLDGAELTCAMAGYKLRALPVMERGLHHSGIGSHAIDATGDQPAHTSDIITPELEKTLAAWSVRFCEALSIRDFARFDYKMDRSGTPLFLEVNPLPTFAVDSTYAILAELEGVPYPNYLGGILSEAIRRLHMDITKSP